MKLRNELETYQQYLASLAAEIKNPDQGFFGPGSISWRVNGAGVKGLGAFRAAFLQVANRPAPLENGVNSVDIENYYSRVERIFQTQQQIIFGTCDQAINALTNLYVTDSHLTGGYRPHGQFVGCAAQHPALQVWLFGTLLDSLVRSHGLISQPLHFGEQETLYQERRIYAGLIGIPGDILPPNLLEFYDWISGVLTRDQFQVTQPAREIARDLLRVPSPVFWPVNYIIAVGLLPGRMREAYGCFWNPTLELLFNTSLGMVQQVASRLPVRMRASGGYWHALKRAKV